MFPKAGTIQKLSTQGSRAVHRHKRLLALLRNRDIFVGGALPFGVVKVGIDTYEDNVSYSTLNGGYTPNGRVTAISMLHESGTGGFPKYGVVPQMPLTDVSPPVNLLDNTRKLRLIARKGRTINSRKM